MLENSPKFYSSHWGAEAYRIRADLAIGRTSVDTGVGLGPGSRDDAVDDGVRYVHTLGPVFPGNRLREGPLRPLTGSEGSESRRPLNGGCCAGHDERGRVGRGADGILE